MQCMFPAERAVFVHFELFRNILFVFLGVVIALFAFTAGKRNLLTCTFLSHLVSSAYKLAPG